jgi:small-conductance mechanosensitive channel
MAALGLAALVASAPPPACAQDDNGVATPGETQPVDAPSAIPISEAAAQAEAASQVLRQAAEEGAPKARVTEIKREAPKRLRGIEEMAARGEQAAAAASSPQMLADLEFAWKARRKQLRTWTRILTDRARDLDAQIAIVQRLQQTWQLTLETGRGEGAPAVVLERAASIAAEARSLEDELKERRSAVLSLQARITEGDQRITEVLAQIAGARSALRTRLIEQDLPPLWAARARIEGTDQTLDDMVRSAVATEVDELRTYVTEHPTEILARLAIQLVLFAAALYAVVALRARVLRQQEAEHRPVGAYESIFVHPISAAVLVALLPMVRMYPDAPGLIGELYGLALLIPLLFLLPALLGHGLRRPLFGFAAFYLVDRARFLVDAIPVIERFLLLVEAAVALVLTGWLLRPVLARPAPLLSARTLGARLALGLLGVTVGASALGYFTLATVIWEALLSAAYLGLLLFAAANVLSLVVASFLRGRVARRVRVIRAREQTLERRASRLIRWVAAALWVLGTLDVFTVLDPAVAVVGAWASAPIVLGAISFSLGDILGFVLVVLVALWISRILRLVLEEDVFPRTRLGRGIPYAISATIQYVVLFVGFVMALGAAGFDLSNVTLLAGAFGVGIGFGLQNVVNNFTSGLVLLFERPIQVGDTVQVGEVMGEIRRIGLRSSTLRSWQGAEVIVPNANLISDQVTNWTLSDRQRRIELRVGVAYGTDPERVLALLLDVARSHPSVLDAPEPSALFLGFGDSALDFELRAWTGLGERFMAIRSDLAVGVNRAFNEAGITIPFPQRDLHVKSIVLDPATTARIHFTAAPPSPAAGARAPGAAAPRDRESISRDDE